MDLLKNGHTYGVISPVGQLVDILWHAGEMSTDDYYNYAVSIDANTVRIGNVLWERVSGECDQCPGGTCNAPQTSCEECKYNIGAENSSHPCGQQNCWYECEVCHHNNWMYRKEYDARH